MQVGERDKTASDRFTLDVKALGSHENQMRK